MKHGGNQGGRPKGKPKTGGRRRGVKNKRTLGMEAALTAKREGVKLGVDYLREMAALSTQLVEATRPREVDGEMKAGDLQECSKWIKMLTNVAALLAQYESPRLSAMAVAPPQRETYQRMTLRVFDSKGNKRNEIDDGERQPPVPRGEGETLMSEKAVSPATRRSHESSCPLDLLTRSQFLF
jgi:hypothetical protein